MTATDYIYNLTTAFNYNRATEYTMEMCHRVLKRIDKDYDYRIEHKYDGDDMDDCVDILASAIFIAYGDYGTSPRHGWIEDKGDENAIKTALIRRIKELSFMYMQEVLNDT